MKYRVEVNTVSCQPGSYNSTGRWAIEHDTQEEAHDAAVDLFNRWPAVKFWRVTDEDGAIVDTNAPADDVIVQSWRLLRPDTIKIEGGRVVAVTVAGVTMNYLNGDCPAFEGEYHLPHVFADFGRPDAS